MILQLLANLRLLLTAFWEAAAVWGSIRPEPATTAALRRMTSHIQRPARTVASGDFTGHACERRGVASIATRTQGAGQASSLGMAFLPDVARDASVSFQVIVHRCVTASPGDLSRMLPPRTLSHNVWPSG